MDAQPSKGIRSGRLRSAAAPAKKTQAQRAKVRHKVQQAKTQTKQPKPASTPARASHEVQKRPAPPYYGARGWFVAGLLLSLTAIGIGAFMAYDRPVPGWEQVWFLRINGWPESWRVAGLAVTALGSTWMAVVTVGVTFLLKLYWLAWRLAASIIAGYGITALMKLVVGRERPEAFLSDAQVRTTELAAGFPSGHAMLATVVMLTLLPYLPRGWRWVAVAAVIIPVAVSRIYLGVHFPLDVIGGVAMGMFIVCFVRLLPRAIRSALRLG